MSLIPVIQSDGMTVEQGVICKCNVCGHRWLPTDPKKLPKRCARHDCKSILWNRKPMKRGRPKKIKAARAKRRK